VSFFRKNQLKNTSSTKKTVYLTFDDGPSINTPKILDILDEYSIKATFFVCGNTTDFGKEMYKRIVNDGHVIGSHSYTHKYKSIYLSEESFLKDIDKITELIYSTTGIRTEIMRFPGGSNTTYVLKESDRFFIKKTINRIIDSGFQYFDWNVDSKDATKITQDKNIIIESVLKGVIPKDNSIVLFHDSLAKTTTVEALPTILERLIRMGCHFETLKKDSFYVHFRQK